MRLSQVVSLEQAAPANYRASDLGKYRKGTRVVHSGAIFECQDDDPVKGCNSGSVPPGSRSGDARWRQITAYPQPEPWSAERAGSNGYAEYSQVTHNGKVYRCKYAPLNTACNAAKNVPGVSQDWEELGPIIKNSEWPPYWRAGGIGTYKVGDRVTYGGAVWRCVYTGTESYCNTASYRPLPSEGRAWAREAVQPTSPIDVAPVVAAKGAPSTVVQTAAPQMVPVTAPVVVAQPAAVEVVKSVPSVQIPVQAAIQVATQAPARAEVPLLSRPSTWAIGAAVALGGWYFYRR